MRIALLAIVLAGCASPEFVVDAGSDAPIDAMVAADAPPDPCEGITEASVTVVGRLARGRYAPVVHPIADGRVLVAGGYDHAGGISRSAEVFDPRGLTLDLLEPLAIGRNFAAIAPGARGLMVIAGFDDATGSIRSVEVLDEAAGAFVPGPDLGVGREAHTATVLPDGRVVVTGGLQARGFDFLSSIEVYDPAEDRFSLSMTSMTSPRAFHAAIWIEERGSVLLVGGDSGAGELASAERWVAGSGAIEPVAGGRARAGKAVEGVVLDDGRALVCGGANATDGTLADCDVYDPATDRFTATEPMVIRRMAHTLTALGDGRVIAIGGWSDSEPGPSATPSIELRDRAGRWERLPVDLAAGRLDHRVHVIDACHVAVIGGQTAATGIPPTSPRDVELITLPPGTGS